jgi:hypothetical protein
MKKIICLLLLTFALSGCITPDEKNEVTNNNVDTDFALKEKCREYKDIAQERVDEENAELTDYQNERLLIGTYYSKTEDTCISKVYYPKDTQTDNQDIMYQLWGYYIYTDEITDTNLYMYSENPPGYVFYTDKISGDEESTQKSRTDLENSLGLLQ